MDVKEFVEYIVRAICEKKDAIKIEEIRGDRTISINIKCDKSDIGKVIGKKGHIANAIRTLAQHIAYASGSRISITVID
ncbi:MAG: KH domain-containing protein [Candidatus Anstonellales archaeon]